VLFPDDLAERERAYSPSSCLDDLGPYLAEYHGASERARAAIAHQTYRYGSGEGAELDVFPSPDNDKITDRRVHLFFHGGYWQELDKSDASFPAPGFHARGITYVAAGYGLAPGNSLRQIVAEARAAAGWVRSNLCEADGSAQLVVSGSSAGAHLAAWVALTEDVDAAVLLSGVFDLRPLVGTYINEALDLDERSAAELSPLLRVERGELAVPTTIVWGENETDAFKLQSRLYGHELVSAGHPVVLEEIAGRNHFDLVHDLASLSPT
jgi:arylformamidase